MTGKEFLWQYIMIDRKIRSVKLQLDSMTELVSRNMMNDTFQHDINELSDNLKCLISTAASTKKQILDIIQQLNNDNRREILMKYYIEAKSKTQISREMFISFQGVCYHLEVGEAEIEQLINKNERSD